MKREDLKIEGIPEGYRVYDVDLTPSGRPIAVLGHETDKNRPVFVRWHGVDVPLPDDALWWNEHLREFLVEPIMRSAGEDKLAIVSHSPEGSRDVNAGVWNTRAQIEASFHAGEHVQEVLATEDTILLFFDDQGQTGDSALSREAMAVMSTTGEYHWGHATQFGAEALDTWFHAAVWDTPSNLSIFADVATHCAFVRLDLETRQQTVWRPPAPLATPSAVTTVGDLVLLHGAGTDAEGRQFLESFASGKAQRELQERGLDEALSKQLAEYWENDPKLRQMLASAVTPGDIVEWLPGEATWRVIGEWPARQLRGLPGGRFIAVQPDGYTILSFE